MNATHLKPSIMKRIISTIEVSYTQHLMLTGRLCPYCKGEPMLRDSNVVYGRSYGPIWYCEPCNAWVGCHPGTNDPLGRLANATLREAKKRAHEAFDQIWKKKIMSRTAAYAWLSRRLGIPKKYTHIGMFNVETCSKVITLSKALVSVPGYLPH